MTRNARLPSLDGIFRPRSVAVVGASRDPKSIGHEVVRNLVAGGFTGPVYPVNPRAGVVRSMPCYPSLARVPGPVDLAVLVVPAAIVPRVARQCARKRVKGLIVLSAGFREVGGEGARREAELVTIARRGGMRVIGPNCMGVLHTDPLVRLNASFAASEPPKGRVAFASQSGALGEAILADARAVGLGIRAFVSVGNGADIGSNDLLEYWEHDPEVELILLYLESFGDPQRFKAVAERLRGKKPILAVKSGRSAAGARAAGSHTGSVAGEDVAVDTFLVQCGVQRAQTLREMFSLARALLHQPVPKSDGVAVVTNAGGPGILATDALAGDGVVPVALAPRTRARLAKVLPPEASAHNPVDLIASADAGRYRAALRAIVADPGVDALLVLFVSPIMIDALAVARAILETTAGTGKPLVVCLMGRQHGDEATALLQEAGVPVFRFPEEAAHVLSGLLRHRRLAEPPAGAWRRFDVALPKARRFLREKGADGWLESGAARALLAAYGLPVIPTHQTRDAGQAAAAAHALGYPVCLKAVGSGLVHKSDLGGVRVDLGSSDEVMDAAAEMVARIGPRVSDLRLEVQPMAPGHRELLLGLKRDPRFGPLLAIGFGGVTVEVLKDVAVRVGPLRDSDAWAMLESLRGAALLDAFRGQPAVDQELLVDLLLRLNQLAFDNPEVIEVDLNPVIAATKGVPTWVVDARVRVS